ncbi:MAG: ABC transporter permease [Bacteroidales bacterium]|nr:ABC transporter permease [Bacteroidales bacterium]
MSAPLVNIAVASIALGVLVMILSVSILRGFQNEITSKIIGFGSHITIQATSPAKQYTSQPVSTARAEVDRLRNADNIRHLQYFATIGGMAKTDDHIHGIILKGLSPNYDTSFFAQALTQGRMPRLYDSIPSTEIIISQSLSDKLQLTTGQKLRVYFWQATTYRARAFTIAGIYRTDLSEFDDHIIIGDIQQVQKLNKWEADQVSGYELLLHDFSKLDRTAREILPLIDYDLTTTTIVEQNLALFSWLQLLNSNIVLIIAIMALVCIVAIISALLIMIFEKASTIGLLKTLGANNRDIRAIFLYKSASIILRGILIGCTIAFVISILQQQLHLVTLDPESYSMSFVPVEINPITYLLVALGSMAACLLSLLIPATYISHIRPAQSLRFE